MKLPRLSIAAAAFLLLAAAAPARAGSLPVFSGDPTDPATGRAYPMMPSLPLLLPGNDGDFGTGDDVLDTSLHGDVDLCVRVGTVTSSAVPPPAGVAGGASVATVVAGGGTTGQGSEAPLTVMVSDGSGSPPYGNVIASSEIDARPVAIFAFADLDGDGVIGPTDADGSADDELERQEATAYAARQVGPLSHGRLQASIGIEQAAPASIGGLRVALVAGAFTGQVSSALFTDGTMIMTRWPFFPPLDPARILDSATPHPPDPSFPSQLAWNPAHNYLPAPGDAELGTPFALPVDGSEPTTDHLVVVSGAPVSARLFAEADPSTFAARGSVRLHVAPAGGGRALVLAPLRVVLANGTQRTLRLLPVDFFSNVADPSAPMAVTLQAHGSVAIASPDADADPATEQLSLASASGADVVLAGTGSEDGRIDVLVGGSVVSTLPADPAADDDSDGDGVPDDGDGSGVVGDRPCDGATIACDDNCPLEVNPSQADNDHNGIGDCCDGTCVREPSLPGCSECALPAAPPLGAVTAARIRARFGTGGRLDTVVLRLRLTIPDAESLTPDAYQLSLALAQPGRAGYHADLAALARDVERPTPQYFYSDPAGSVAGVFSAALRQNGPLSFKATVRARGADLADLAAGPATLTILLGGEGSFDEDDVVGAPLSCASTGSGIRCKMQ